MKKIFENEIKIDSNLPLFSLRTDNNGKPLEYKNMLLTRIQTKCTNCNFSYRISETQIMKCFRNKEQLRLEPAKRHIQDTGHTMNVSQSFRKYNR